jgi:hypothetical protein
MKQFCLAVTLCALLLSGCARSVSVPPTKLGDAQLSCTQLRSEIEEAQKFRKAAEDNKGVTGTNVAAALFFLPGLVATYSDANDAIRAADDRVRNLTTLYNEKHCSQESQ